MIQKNLLFVGSILMLALFTAACGGSGGGGSNSYEGYRVYANILESADYTSGRYSGDWSDIEDAFEEDDWIYIGEATETTTFIGLEGFTDIMITWTQQGIKFDAFDEPVGGFSLGYDDEGNTIDIWIIRNNLVCDDVYEDCLLGPPDGSCATTTQYQGRIMFSRTGWLYDHPDTFRVTVVP
jgi:hypothetical protein